MKKSSLFFFVLFIAANVFVGCDSSLYDDAPVAVLPENMEVPAADNDSVYYWYCGEKRYLIPDYSSTFIVYNGASNVTAGCDIVSRGDYREAKKAMTTRASKTASKNWVIVNGHKQRTRAGKGNADIYYLSPVYKSPKTGKRIKLSNLIHLKLKAQEDTTILYDQMRKYGLSIYSQNQFMPVWYTLFCETDTYGTALEVSNLLYETGLFAAVEPDFLGAFTTSATSFQIPNDTYYAQQWYLNGTNSINWPEASTITSGEGVKVAIIDTGVDCGHPDFDQSLVRPYYDAYIGDWYTNGFYGSHGTKCAGVISAVANNNKGITGISPKVQLYSIAEPFPGPECDIVIDWPNQSQHLATDLYIALTNCDVVNCSWGSQTVESEEIKDAIYYYGIVWKRNNKGTVMVFASGNEGMEGVSFPANYHDDILVVGASDSNAAKADFSNFGSELDVVAPGVNIVTLGFNDNGTYGYPSVNGTSYAAPQVAAIAALILSVNPNLTNIEVNDIIEQTARKVGGYSYTTTADRPNGTWNNYMGYGLVDATAAVKAAQETLSE